MDLIRLRPSLNIVNTLVYVYIYNPSFPFLKNPGRDLQLSSGINMSRVKMDIGSNRQILFVTQGKTYTMHDTLAGASGTSHITTIGSNPNSRRLGSIAGSR